MNDLVQAQRLLAPLTYLDRVTIAFAALRSLAPCDGEATAIHALSVDRAGSPIAPFISPMDEATFWAGMATPSELDAYCLATFNRMTRNRQVAFLTYVQGRDAA